jgi:hypothetical protein
MSSLVAAVATPHATSRSSKAGLHIVLGMLKRYGLYFAEDLGLHEREKNRDAFDVGYADLNHNH